MKETAATRFLRPRRRHMEMDRREKGTGTVAATVVFRIRTRQATEPVPFFRLPPLPFECISYLMPLIALLLAECLFRPFSLSRLAADPSGVENDSRWPDEAFLCQ